MRAALTLKLQTPILSSSVKAVALGLIVRRRFVHSLVRECVRKGDRVAMVAVAFRYLVQLHKDVPKAARFYSEGLGFTIKVCTLRWAELHSDPLKLALLHSPSDEIERKGYKSLQSFTVPDNNSTVTKLMSLGAEMDGPIKHEIHGKVAAMRCPDGHVLGLYEPS